MRFGMGFPRFTCGSGIFPYICMCLGFFVDLGSTLQLEAFVLPYNLLSLNEKLDNIISVSIA